MGRNSATFGTHALVGSLKWIMRVLDSQGSRLWWLHHPSLLSRSTLPPWPCNPTRLEIPLQPPPPPHKGETVLHYGGIFQGGEGKNGNLVDGQEPYNVLVLRVPRLEEGVLFRAPGTRWANIPSLYKSCAEVVWERRRLVILGAFTVFQASRWHPASSQRPQVSPTSVSGRVADSGKS